MKQFTCAPFGKSFRTKKEKELIQIEKEHTKVQIHYQKSDRDGKIEAQLGEGKAFLLNGIKLKKLSELLRKLIYSSFSSR